MSGLDWYVSIVALVLALAALGIAVYDHRRWRRAVDEYDRSIRKWED